MAIARFGPIVQQISGSLGSVTFKGGAASGVLTRRAARRSTPSDSQRSAQIIFAAHTARWSSMDPLIQTTWKQLGKAVGRIDRLGIRRPLSARSAYLRYMQTVDPDGSHLDAGDTPPGAQVQYPAPIDWIFFELGAFAYVTVLGDPPAGCIERLWIRRMLNFGNRDTAGRRVYVGEQARPYQTLDWLSYLGSPPLDLQPFERIELSITWTSTAAPWPSSPSIAQTSVV